MRVLSLSMLLVVVGAMSGCGVTRSVHHRSEVGRLRTFEQAPAPCVTERILEPEISDEVRVARIKALTAVVEVAGRIALELIRLHR